MANPNTVTHPNEYNYDFTQAHKVLGGCLSDNSRSSAITSYGKFLIDDWKIASSSGQMLEPLQADLVDISLFAYLADRLSPRSKFFWVRRLKVKFPVRCLDIWEKKENHKSLAQLLNYFTEDEWQIEFCAKQAEKRGSELQTFLFPQVVPKQLKVALVSGGLDSFAGIAQQLFEFPDHHFVLVSGVTNPRQGALQKKQIAIINNRISNRITHVPVKYGILHESKQKEERSQRTRGFLFMAIGAATAINIGVNELCIYENGIGAINLPYDGSQLGTSNTRAVHPLALLRMSHFLSQLFNIKFHISNPFMFKTKAQMCAHPNVRQFDQDIQLTFSCDGFPIRKKDQPQCGICTSCLLRRLSLEGASLQDPPFGYLYDLFTPTNFPMDKLKSLFAMEWQVLTIKRCLENNEPWQSLVKEFPALMDIVAELCASGIVDPKTIRTNLLALYSQYVQEWLSFSARKSLSNQAIAA